MSEATLRRIMIALAVLAVAWIIVMLGRRGGGPAEDGQLAQALMRLQQDTARGFTITAAGSAPIEIARTDGAWTVDGMAADSDAVNRLRSAVSAATVADLVSTSPGNHERLGVGTDSAWALAVRAGDQSHTFLLGKSAQRTGHTYVRLPDDDRTWEVSGDLRAAAAHPLAEWRDRVLARVDTTAVSRIEVTRNDTTYFLARGDDGWALADGAAADSSAVHAILSELLRFTATSIAPDTATFDGPGRRRVVVISTAGDTAADLEFAGGKYIWRGRAAGNPALYTVASYAIDRLAPPRTTLTKGHG